MFCNAISLNSINRSLVLVSLVFALGATHVSAEDNEWDVKLGAGIINTHKYFGGSETETRALPMVDITWRDRVYLNVQQGLGVHLLTDSDFNVDVGVGFDIGRNENESDLLRLLGDVDESATASVNVGYRLGLVGFNLQVSDRLDSDQGGTLMSFGSTLRLPIQALLSGQRPDSASDGPRGPMITLGLKADWADDDYMDTYFGVTEGQSASTGIASFSTDSGLRSVSANLGLVMPLSESWRAQLSVSYTELADDVSDSPIVEDQEQISTGLFVIRSF